MDDINEILGELNLDGAATQGDGGGWGDSAPEAQPQVEAPAPAPAPEKRVWRLNVNGKEITTDDEAKLTDWAQRGYDYAQKVGEWNKERESWNAERSKFQKYTEIDQFAQSNPDWWQHVEQSWLSRAGQHSTDGQANPAIQSIVEKELQPVREFLQELQSERKAELERKADETLRDEVESIQKKYQNLDFNRIQPSGKTLESEVLDHAIRNGFPSFKAAFLDYYGDNLIEMTRQSAKEEALKTIQNNNRSGVLGESPTRQVKPGEFSYNSQKSYNDLAKEALAELGIT